MEEWTRGASSRAWWAGGKEEGETRRKQEVRMGRRQREEIERGTQIDGTMLASVNRRELV